MKRILTIVLVFIMTFSASAQSQLLGTYKVGGEDKPVYYNQKTQTVFIETYDDTCNPYIVLSGDERIGAFKKALIETKDTFTVMKKNTPKATTTEMPVLFNSFTVSWSKSRINYTGISGDLHPILHVSKENGTLAARVAIMGETVDFKDRRTKASFFMLFNDENEIQQLIDLLSFNSNLAKVSDQCPPGAVDLGLKTLDGNKIYWASCNLGASSPEDFGDYYSWGEIDPRTNDLEISPSNYKWVKRDGWDTVYTKYNNSNKGIVDNKIVLDPEDDAAHVRLGEYWHMPTKEEYLALVENRLLTWEWTTLNGINGYKITSNISGYEGNWVFLPAAGMRLGDHSQDEGSRCIYWLPYLDDPRFPDYAKVIDFNEIHHYDSLSSVNRYIGLPIRPVYAK